MEYSVTEMQISLGYSLDNFSDGQASSVIFTISRLLEALVSNPSIEIGQLDVCDESQQSPLSNTLDRVRSPACLHEVIMERVLEAPESEAVCAHDGSLSYGELWSLSNRLSRHIITLGVKPGTYVPFCFQKSKWSIVAILSILKAGGCCVPMDPSYPTSRLRHMVNMVDANVALTSDTNYDLLRHMVATPLNVNQSFFDDNLDIADVTPITNVKPVDAAYVIFTSGTTGEPKGSVLEHQSIHEFSLVLGPSLNINLQSRVLQFASFVFDLSIEEIVGTLSHGGCVCIPSDNDRINDLASAMEGLQVNWANLTPTVIRTLKPSDVPHLKTLVSAGEMLPDDVVKTWAPAVEMFNTYGPSECTVAATISGRIRETDRGANIGKGRSCKIWVVNPANHNLLSPVGAIGEILIEGKQVGRGYLKRPEQTAAAFITDPAWAKKGLMTRCESLVPRRMYKSGDLARFDEDGSLVYFGRKDQQIKIRGQRVELSEVEHHLSARSTVQSVAAAVPRKGYFKDRLIAVVVLSITPGFPDTEHDNSVSSTEGMDYSQLAVNQYHAGSRHLAELATSLGEILPRHMVPSLIIPIYQLPLLLSGKVNRRALDQWLATVDQETIYLLTREGNTDAVDLPSNDIESQLRDMWTQLLGLPVSRIGVKNSFFGLGGDSILAMQMSSRLREANLRVTVQEIFEHKTISKIASIMSTEVSNEESVQVQASVTSPKQVKYIQQVPQGAFGNKLQDTIVEDAFQCSSIQEDILAAQAVETQAWIAIDLFEARLEPESDPVNIDTLENAWDKVVRHHGILRTVFVPMPDGDVERHWQVVLRHVKPSITRCEMNDAEVSQLKLQSTSLEPHLPAHRLIIIRTSTRKTFISLQISHALYDAVAISILLRDFRLAYEGVTLEASPPFSSYFLATQLSLDISSDSHWKSILHGYQPDAIGINSIDDPTDGVSMRMIQADVSDHRKLYNYCQDQSVTLANLFQSVWAICLRKFSNSDDVCFGNMTSARELAGSGVSGVVGPCVNVLPCRVRFAKSMTVHDLQKGLEKDLLVTLSHQHVSSRELRRIACVEDQSRPLFETYINVRRIRHQQHDCTSALSLRNVGSYMLEAVSDRP